MITLHADSNFNKSKIDKLVGENELLVSSIFYTLQGEGPYTGYPSVFIRLAGCNYGSKTKVCEMCDTSFEVKNAKKYTIDHLIEVVEGYFKENKVKKKLIVVTGGEPCLQHNLLKFLYKYHHRNHCDYYSQIETNGSQKEFFKTLLTSQEDYIRVLRDDLRDSSCLFVCSPKASQYLKKYIPLSEETLEICKYFKFLLSADPDSVYHKLPEELVERILHKPAFILVSPIAEYSKSYDGEISSIWDDSLIDKEKTSRNYSYASQYIMKHADIIDRLSLQTHLFTAIP